MLVVFPHRSRHKHSRSHAQTQESSPPNLRLSPHHRSSGDRGSAHLRSAPGWYLCQKDDRRFKFWESDTYILPFLLNFGNVCFLFARLGRIRGPRGNASDRLGGGRNSGSVSQLRVVPARVSIRQKRGEETSRLSIVVQFPTTRGTDSICLDEF